jgi:hypothetical protein
MYLQPIFLAMTALLSATLTQAKCYDSKNENYPAINLEIFNDEIDMACEILSGPMLVNEKHSLCGYHGMGSGKPKKFEFIVTADKDMELTKERCIANFRQEAEQCQKGGFHRSGEGFMFE